VPPRAANINGDSQPYWKLEEVPERGPTSPRKVGVLPQDASAGVWSRYLKHGARSVKAEGWSGLRVEEGGRLLWLTNLTISGALSGAGNMGRIEGLVSRRLVCARAKEVNVDGVRVGWLRRWTMCWRRLGRRIGLCWTLESWEGEVKGDVGTA
jgi:hypothetical protein